MSNIRVFLPLISLFPYGDLFPERAIGRVARSGFSGIEILCNNWIHGRIPYIEATARRYFLETRYHQGWRLEDNRMYFNNKILHSIGYLYRQKGESVGYQQEQIPPGAPFVAYAEQVRRKQPFGTCFQTCACFFPIQVNYKWLHRIQFDEFLKEVLQHRYPVVFDTQHVLEFALGVPNVEKLGEYTNSDLNRKLFELWDILGPLTTEIHCNNFIAGGNSDRGRNVPLHDGTLNLHAFAHYVRQGGWSGVVTPEIPPSLPRMYSLEYLTLLRKTVENDFQ